MDSKEEEPSQTDPILREEIDRVIKEEQTKKLNEQPKDLPIRKMFTFKGTDDEDCSSIQTDEHSSEEDSNRYNLNEPIFFTPLGNHGSKRMKVAPTK